jgi:hypothetical protein
MLLWHGTIGTIGLAYSARIGPNELIFSAVSLNPANRRSASGTTPGAFAIFNMCKLQKDYINGVIFNGSQPVPLWFYGKEDKKTRSRESTGPVGRRSRRPIRRRAARQATGHAWRPIPPLSLHNGSLIVGNSAASVKTRRTMTPESTKINWFEFLAFPHPNQGAPSAQMATPSASRFASGNHWLGDFMRGAPFGAFSQSSNSRCMPPATVAMTANENDRAPSSFRPRSTGWRLTIAPVSGSWRIAKEPRCWQRRGWSILATAGRVSSMRLAEGVRLVRGPRMSRRIPKTATILRCRRSRHPTHVAGAVDHNDVSGGAWRSAFLRAGRSAMRFTSPSSRACRTHDSVGIGLDRMRKERPEIAFSAGACRPSAAPRLAGTWRAEAE